MLVFTVVAQPSADQTLFLIAGGVLTMAPDTRLPFDKAQARLVIGGEPVAVISFQFITGKASRRQASRRDAAETRLELGIVDRIVVDLLFELGGDV